MVDDGSSSPAQSEVKRLARVLVKPREPGTLPQPQQRSKRMRSGDRGPLRLRRLSAGGVAAPLRAAFAADPRLAIMGFTTEGTGGRATASAEEEPDVLGLVLGRRLDALRQRLRPRSALPEHLSVFTCAMAVRREAFVSVGGFDEAFDWLDLDHDLSMRLRRAGWRVAVHPALRRGNGSCATTYRSTASSATRGWCGRSSWRGSHLSLERWWRHAPSGRGRRASPTHWPAGGAPC